MTAIIIIAIIAVLILIWCVSTLNGFKRQEIRVNESLSDIEVALTKRCGLLTKMLDTAKNYMKNEKETFTGTIKLRRGMTVGELNTAAGEVDALSGKLAAVAEGYPELRSADVFVELQKGIRDAEEHLQAARRLYNSNVTKYNTAISVFPANLLSGGRKPIDFFAATEGAKSDVKMDF